MKNYFTLVMLFFICLMVRAQNAPSIHVSLYDTEDPAVVGSSTVYVLSVRNEGTQVAKNIQVTCKIPIGMEFVKARGPAAFKKRATDIVFMPVLHLTKGKVLHYQMMFRATKVGFTKASVFIKVDELPTILQEEATNVISARNIKAPAIHVSCYDTEDPCYSKGHKLANKTTYVVEVRNEGSAPLNNVCLENKIPQTTKFFAAKGPCDYQFVNGIVKFSPLLNLLPGKAVRYIITVKPLTPGNIKNIAIVKFSESTIEIIRQESTTVKRFWPFFDRGYIIGQLIEVGEAGQLVRDSQTKSVFAVGGELAFNPQYKINGQEVLLKVKSRYLQGYKIKISMEYYINHGKKLLLRKDFNMQEWQPLVVLLDGQQSLAYKKYLRIIPRLQKEKIPRDVTDLLLHFDTFYFFDMQKQRLLATGGVSGHIIGINIPDVGLFEISLQKFADARRVGILLNNEISIYSQENWKTPSYKIVATNTIISGNRCWVWVRRSPARPGDGVTIETKVYKK